jgi:polysaccharide deacetylase 2 family uncharacterized protein YibQ
MKTLLATVAASFVLFAASIVIVHQTPAPERAGAKYVLRIEPEADVFAQTQAAAEAASQPDEQAESAPASEAAEPTAPDDGEPQDVAAQDNPNGGEVSSSPWDARLNEAPREEGPTTPEQSAALTPPSPDAASGDMFGPAFRASPAGVSPTEQLTKALADDSAPAENAELRSEAVEPPPPGQTATGSTALSSPSVTEPPATEPSAWQTQTSKTPTPSALRTPPPLPRKRAQSQPPIPRESSSLAPVTTMRTAGSEQRNAAEVAELITGSTGVALAARGQAGTPSPRIAIVVRDLGLDERDTNSAIQTLRQEVTLAFSPYGRDIKAWAMKARQSGHEVFAGVPMEPLNAAGAAEAAPNMLLASLPPSENMRRLAWALGQIEGHEGVINMMGGKLAQTPEAIRPFMQTLKAQNIPYIDDGAAAHPYAIMLAAQLDVRYRIADGTVGSRPSAALIQRELQKLETIAREKGSALGVAYAGAETIRQLVIWSASLPSKNIVLVPASQIVTSMKL